jgi:hypothetical protein
MIAALVHEIKMAFVLFANAFSAPPAVCKPPCKRLPLRGMPGWRHQSVTLWAALSSYGVIQRSAK